MCKDNDVAPFNKLTLSLINVPIKKINAADSPITRPFDRIAAVKLPGIAFGIDEYVRISYACSENEFIEGLNRLEKFILKIMDNCN